MLLLIIDRNHPSSKFFREKVVEKNKTKNQGGTKDIQMSHLLPYVIVF